MNEIIWRNPTTGATVTLTTDEYGAHRIAAFSAGGRTVPGATGDREWAESLANGLALRLGATAIGNAPPSDETCSVCAVAFTPAHDVTVVWASPVSTHEAAIVCGGACLDAVNRQRRDGILTDADVRRARAGRPTIAGA